MKARYNMNEDIEYDCAMRLKKLRQQAADRKRTVTSERYKRYNAKRAKKRKSSEKFSETSSTGRSMSSMSGCSSESVEVVDVDNGYA